MLHCCCGFYLFFFPGAAFHTVGVIHHRHIQTTQHKQHLHNDTHIDTYASTLIQRHAHNTKNTLTHTQRIFNNTYMHTHKHTHWHMHINTVHNTYTSPQTQWHIHNLHTHTHQHIHNTQQHIHIDPYKTQTTYTPDTYTNEHFVLSVHCRALLYTPLNVPATVWEQSQTQSLHCI